MNPRPGFALSGNDRQPAASLPVKIPQLMRLYLGYGAKVCGLPAIDRRFRTIDYLMALDGESVDESTRRMFEPKVH